MNREEAEYQERFRASMAEFDRALRGEREVFCLVCKRSLPAVNPRIGFGGPLRVIFPQEHNSPAPIGRARCSGSFMQATLS